MSQQSIEQNELISSVIANINNLDSAQAGEEFESIKNALSAYIDAQTLTGLPLPDLLQEIILSIYG